MQKLKLSKDTVAVLKNYNRINPMMYFRKGNTISTISPTKTVFAKYVCPENFKTDFGIYKLDKLLSVLSFFADPELVIGDKNLVIKDNNSSAKIAFADPASLVYPQKDKIDLPTIDAEFDVTEAEISDVIKASSIMELPFIAFESDGQKLYLKALDYKNPNSDAYTIELAENTDHDVGGDFQAIFNITNLQMIPADYHVQISAKGIAQFSNDKMTYWIAVEKDSQF